MRTGRACRLQANGAAAFGFGTSTATIGGVSYVRHILAMLSTNHGTCAALMAAVTVRGG